MCSSLGKAASPAPSFAQLPESSVVGLRPRLISTQLGMVVGIIVHSLFSSQLGSGAVRLQGTASDDTRKQSQRQTSDSWSSAHSHFLSVSWALGIGVFCGCVH